MTRHGYGRRVGDDIPLTQFWPPDFCLSTVTRYELQPAPLDPLIRHCLRCKARNCDTCLPDTDRTPPDYSSKARDNAKQTGEESRARILAALREHGPQTVYELRYTAQLTYSALRRHLDAMAVEGVVTKTLTPNKRSHVNVYTVNE